MEISQIEVSEDEVMERLSELDTTKSCGPDKIPARLLKECSEQIAPSLCSLFNHSLSLGQISREWKSADVTPIHKKDSKEAAKNYRPISLLPTRGGGGGTWIFFGWVFAARHSKLPPRSKKNFP